MKTDGGIARNERAFADLCKEAVPDTFRTSSLAKKSLSKGNHTEKTPLFLLMNKLNIITQSLSIPLMERLQRRSFISL